MNFDLSYTLLIPLLQWFAKTTNSYGWSIILLTVLVRLAVWPLVASSTRSMQKMSLLQPKLKELQDKYKEQPEELQKHMMNLYKHNKANPVAGCLPLLIQMPILIALYGTFAGPPFSDKPIDVVFKVVPQSQAKEATHQQTSKNNSPYIDKDGNISKIAVFPGDGTIVQGEKIDFGTRAIAGNLPPDFKVNWRTFSQRDSKNVETITKFFDSGYQVTFNDVGEWHVQALIPGIAKNDSFLFVRGLGKVATKLDLLKPENFDTLFLIIAFAVTMFISQKFTVTQPKTAPGQELDEQQKIQQDTMKVMPVMMTVMFAFMPLPTGVFLYMTVSNILQTLQTMLIMTGPPPKLVDVTGGDTVTMNQSADGKTFSIGDASANSGNGNSDKGHTVKLNGDPDVIKLEKKKKPKKK